jgi:hypothetical protein
MMSVCLEAPCAEQLIFGGEQVNLIFHSRHVIIQAVFFRPAHLSSGSMVFRRKACALRVLLEMAMPPIVERRNYDFCYEQALS